MKDNQSILDHSLNADKLAEGYASIDRYSIYPELYKFLESKIKAGRKLNVLDIGCGSGEDVYQIATMGHKVLGLEPSDLINKAKKHPNASYRCDMLPKLETISDNDKFDVVILSAVIQYIDTENLIASFITIGKILKNNGTLFISYPSPPSREYQNEYDPSWLDTMLEIASQELEPNQHFKSCLEFTKTKDSRNRKTLDGRDIYFYTHMIQNNG